MCSFLCLLGCVTAWDNLICSQPSCLSFVEYLGVLFTNLAFPASEDLFPLLCSVPR